MAAPGLQRLLHGDPKIAPSPAAEDGRVLLSTFDDGVQEAMNAKKAAQAAQAGIAGISAALREAAAAAAAATDGDLSSDDRATLQVRLDSALHALDKVAQDTGFGGVKLLDGSIGAHSSSGGLTFGPLGQDDTTITLTLEALGSKDLGLAELDLSSREGARKAADAFGLATGNIDGYAEIVEQFGANADDALRHTLSVRNSTATAGKAVSAGDLTRVDESLPGDNGAPFGAGRATSRMLARLLE